MVTRVPQVVVSTVIVGVVALGACDSPARVKPWRHAPDPIAESAHRPGSRALAEATGDADDIRTARDHTLRIHVDSEPGKLHPVLAPSLWARRITVGTIFETLIRYLPPEPGQPAGRYAPRLARSWSVVTPPWGGLEVRIELEPTARFHDNHPLTSSDVQFTLDYIRDPAHKIDHLRPLLDDVDKVELITPTEVRLVLKRANGWVVRALAEIPILPMHIYDGNFATQRLIGSGPWKLVANRHGAIHLTRFDEYWGRKPSIADLEFVYQPDAARALIDAKRGELDIIPALIPAHWPDQANAPGIAASFGPLELRPLRMRYLKFNTARPPLDDPRVRHAIALLVDRKEIAERHFGRLARPALWPMWPGGPVHGGEPAVPAFDPKQAGALLDAAGWIDSDRDGIRDRAGEQLKFVMIGGEHPAPKDIAAPTSRLPREYLIEGARRNGVVIELKTGNEAWLAKRYGEGNYHLVELQWSGVVDGDISELFAPPAPRPAASPGGATGKLAKEPITSEPINPALASALAARLEVFTPIERAHQAANLVTALTATWPLAGIVADAPQGLVHRRVRGLRVWDGWFDATQLSLDGGGPEP